MKKFDDIVITKKPKVAEILGFEINNTYNIKEYSCNPCRVNNEYQLINCNNVLVGSVWMIKAINDPTTMEKIESKVMTISEIENILGYSVKIVEEKESAN